MAAPWERHADTHHAAEGVEQPAEVLWDLQAANWAALGKRPLVHVQCSVEDQLQGEHEGRKDRHASWMGLGMSIMGP
jgi:hypothetical protein